MSIFGWKDLLPNCVYKDSIHITISQQAMVKLAIMREIMSAVSTEQNNLKFPKMLFFHRTQNLRAWRWSEDWGVYKLQGRRKQGSMGCFPPDFGSNTHWLTRICFIRAQPDWTYECLTRTGPDTQICRTGPAGQRHSCLITLVCDRKRAIY